MSDVILNQLSVMGFCNYIPQSSVPMVFFKMTIASRVGLIIVKDSDLIAENMALLKKMIAAFKATLVVSDNIDFAYDFIWILGADTANCVTNTELELDTWLGGCHMVGKKRAFIYPTLSEIANNSRYKSLVWRSFSEYLTL